MKTLLKIFSMKKQLLLAMLSVAVIGCSSSDNVDMGLDDGSPNGSPNGYTWGGDTEDDPDAKIYYFDDIITDDDYKSLNTVKQIEYLLSEIEDGDIIMFGAKTYNITEDLDLTKSVTLRGVGEYPTINESDQSAKEVAGYGEIQTEFVHSVDININIKANDIKLNHLRLTGNTNNTGTKATIEMIGASTSNFQLDNVHFNQGTYLLSPRDAMPHGLKCRYVSFAESTAVNFFVNRTCDHLYTTINTYKPYMDVLKVEKMEFYRCYFSYLYDPDASNTRGFSIDGGNTENPSILDFDNMQIRECYFYETGFASSKCQNFQIIDCEFYVSDYFDAPLHIEEFTTNATIKGNKFTCDNFEKPIMHSFDNSTIEDNIVTGTCWGFMTGIYSEGLTVKNNDCSGMTPTSLTAVTLWKVTRGNRDITITGNIFPSGSTISVKATAEYEGTIDVSDNGGATGGYSNCTGYTYPLDDKTSYSIKNIGNNKYLRATSANGNVELVSSGDLDAACVWEVTRVWPFLYNAYNEYYDTYLFIEKDTEGYSSVDNAIAAKIPLQTKSFASGLRVPVWEFSTQTNGGNIIGPGGGNHGCVGIYDDDKLYCHKRSDRSSCTITEDDLLWVFTKYGN